MYYKITENYISSTQPKELGIYSNRRNALMDYTKCIDDMKNYDDIKSINLLRCYDNDVIKQETITYNITIDNRQEINEECE